MTEIPEDVRKIVAAVYAKNFERIFGKIDRDPTEGELLFVAETAVMADRAARLSHPEPVAEPVAWNNGWINDWMGRHDVVLPNPAYAELKRALASPTIPQPSPPNRDATEQSKLIEAIIAGTAPMSRWVASVDYSTYDEFLDYLKSQLREKLSLKVSLDKNRDDKENLATFVDGGVAALEGALGTYRIVREREATAAPDRDAIRKGALEEAAKAAFVEGYTVHDGADSAVDEAQIEREALDYWQHSLARAIASDPTPETSGWNFDMDAAPHQGEIILLDADGGRWAARWVDDDGWFEVNNHPTDNWGFGVLTPVAWQHFPAASPKGTRE